MGHEYDNWEASEEFIAVNTDAQDLKSGESKSGENSTKGRTPRAYGGDSFGIPGIPGYRERSFVRYGETVLWSTLMLPAGSRILSGGPGYQQYRLFSNPLGQAGQGFSTPMTRSQTNLREGGRVPAGVGYDVYQVQWEISSDSSLLARALSQAGTISWDFIQTSIEIAPLNYRASDWHGPSAAGFTGGYLYRKHLVGIPGNSTFAMTVLFAATGIPGVDDLLAQPTQDPVTIRVSLTGSYKNVIEIG